MVVPVGSTKVGRVTGADVAGTAPVVGSLVGELVVEMTTGAATGAGVGLGTGGLPPSVGIVG